MKRILAVLLVMGITAPGWAAEWEMYGSARSAYFYNDFDDAGEAFLTNVFGENPPDLDFGLTGNSVIGASIKVNDALAGRFEYGAAGGVDLRLLYGIYSFGANSVLVGQDWTPMVTDFSNQVIDWDDNLASVGAPDDGRLAQIKLKLGGFEAALIENSALNVDDLDTDVSLPKIQVAYQFMTDTLFIMPFVGYQVYEIENGDGETDSITAYVVGARSRTTLGPAYVNFSAMWSQNPGNFGLSTFYNASTSTARRVDGAIEDAEELDLAAVAGFRIFERLSIEAGVGYTHSEVDAADDDTWEQTTWAYYVNASLTAAPGFLIVPEIGYYDFGDLETSGGDSDLGERLYYGAKVQIDF